MLYAFKNHIVQLTINNVLVNNTSLARKIKFKGLISYLLYYLDIREKLENNNRISLKSIWMYRNEIICYWIAPSKEKILREI